MNLQKVPIIDSLIGKELLERIRKFEPKLIDMETATKMIQESNLEYQKEVK